MGRTTEPRAESQSDRNGLLFLCDANAVRSQMAEGFARFIAPANLEIYSAGAAPGQLDPLAVRAMKEVGVDISNHRCKSLADIPINQIATIVTLCSEQECPPLPSHALHLHWPLPDPTTTRGSDDEILHAYRSVRDSIRQLVSRMF